MTIKSPHEMYVQFCGQDDHDSYHRLRTDMRFYENKDKADKYRIPALLLFEGLLCAIPYPKYMSEWHRSRIISIDGQNKCKLFLIDIGIS